MAGCQELEYGRVSGAGIWQGVRRWNMAGCRGLEYGSGSGDGIWQGVRSWNMAGYQEMEPRRMLGARV